MSSVKISELDQNRIAYVYQIKNKKNNKSYIGQTIRPPRRRFLEHKYELNHNKHFNKYLQNSWNKYGKENFEFLVLEETEIKNIDEKERYYINLYGTYNFQSGGEGNKKLSEETKEKLRIISKINNSKPEVKKVISEASTKRWEDETYRTSVIERMREVANSEESLKRYSKNSKKAWENNDSRRKNMSDRFSGTNNIRSRKVVCTNTGKVFNTMKEAGEFYNIRSYLKISMVCSGKRNYCGKLKSGEKLHWVYLEDYDKHIKYKTYKRSEVICLNTGEVFKSIKVASLFCGLKNPNCIYNNCIGKTASAGRHPITNEKLYWLYLDDYEQSIEKERRYIS